MIIKKSEDYLGSPVRKTTVKLKTPIVIDEVEITSFLGMARMPGVECKVKVGRYSLVIPFGVWDRTKHNVDTILQEAIAHIEKELGDSDGK